MANYHFNLHGGKPAFYFYPSDVPSETTIVNMPTEPEYDPILEETACDVAEQVLSTDPDDDEEDSEESDEDESEEEDDSYSEDDVWEIGEEPSEEDEESGASDDSMSSSDFSSDDSDDEDFFPWKPLKSQHLCTCPHLRKKNKK